MITETMDESVVVEVDVVPVPVRGAEEPVPDEVG